MALQQASERGRDETVSEHPIRKESLLLARVHSHLLSSHALTHLQICLCLGGVVWAAHLARDEGSAAGTPSYNMLSTGRKRLPIVRVWRLDTRVLVYRLREREHDKRQALILQLKKPGHHFSDQGQNRQCLASNEYASWQAFVQSKHTDTAVTCSSWIDSIVSGSAPSCAAARAMACTCKCRA